MQIFVCTRKRNSGFEYQWAEGNRANFEPDIIAIWSEHSETMKHVSYDFAWYSVRKSKQNKIIYRCWDFPLQVVFVLLLLAVPMPWWLQICELAATMCLKRIAGINVVTPLFTWLPCRLQVAMRIGDAYRDIESNITHYYIQRSHGS